MTDSGVRPSAPSGPLATFPRDAESYALLLWRLLLLLLLLGAWLQAGPTPPTRLASPLLAGAALLLSLVAWIAWLRIRPGTRGAVTIILLGYLCELALLALLTARLGGGTILIVWALMAFRTLALRLWSARAAWAAWLVPLGFLATMLATSTLPWSDALLSTLAIALLVAVAQRLGSRLAQDMAAQAYLGQRLAQRESDLGVRTQVLTQTATNLATRVLELRSLQEGIKAMNASLALETLLEGTVENVAQLFGGTSCAIGLSEPNGTLRIAAQSSSPPLEADVLPLAQQVTRRGAPERHDFASPRDGSTIHGLAVPMVVEGETIGALVACRSEGLSFTGDDQQRLATFADQAALAVNKSRLYERVASLYREVKDRSEELEAILDGIGDAVVVTNRDGALELTNAVASVILGLPDPLPVDATLPPELLRSSFSDHLANALGDQNKDSVLGELTILHEGPLQVQRSYQALSAPLRDSDGLPRGVVTVLRDVTASKQLERLKSNFVSTISHELKTPLHTIKGFLNIVLAERSAGVLTATQRDFLSTARDQTNRLERLILDLLEFNRLESGQITLKPEPLDLAELAATTMDQFRALAHEAHVTLECAMEGPLRAEGDVVRIEQVLHNLVGNALKFTPEGGRVTISGQPVGDCVEVVVTDTGIGIAPEVRDRVFERFFQVDSAQDRRYGGTGLGLAICKHIVERHGGRIWVDGALGQGSAFHVLLPRELGRSRTLTVDFSELKVEEENT